MIDMIKATKMRWWSWIVALSSMVLVCLMNVSPIYILICVMVMAFAIAYFNEKKKEGLK
jgi:hypothetical protein